MFDHTNLREYFFYKTSTRSSVSVKCQSSVFTNLTNSRGYINHDWYNGFWQCSPDTVYSGKITSCGNNITITKKEHLPNLCSIAFKNSKQNKYALKVLRDSQTISKLDDIDKLPLLKSINDQLLKLSKQNKALKARSQTNKNEVKLKQITK